METNDFLNNIEQDVASAKTDKALKFLARKLTSYTKSIMHSTVANPKLKKAVKNRYKRILSSIKKKIKVS